jgi:hypothetical protein
VPLGHASGISLRARWQRTRPWPCRIAFKSCDAGASQRALGAQLINATWSAPSNPTRVAPVYSGAALARRRRNSVVMCPSHLTRRSQAHTNCAIAIDVSRRGVTKSRDAGRVTAVADKHLPTLKEKNGAEHDSDDRAYRHGTPVIHVWRSGFCDTRWRVAQNPSEFPVLHVIIPDRDR